MISLVMSLLFQPLIMKQKAILNKQRVMELVIQNVEMKLIYFANKKEKNTIQFVNIVDHMQNYNRPILKIDQ